MPPLFLLAAGRHQALINLALVQAIETTDYGLDVYMADPRASICIECDPAEAKGLFASLFNEIQRCRGVPAVAVPGEDE